MLGWAPSIFWSSTTDEFLEGLEGWKMANGYTEEQKPTAEPLTMEELYDLMERRPDG